MIDIGMNERTKKNALQARKSPWKNTIAHKIEIKSNLKPIDEPKQQYWKQWHGNYPIGKFKLLVHLMHADIYKLIKKQQKSIQKQFSAILSSFNPKAYK